MKILRGAARYGKAGRGEAKQGKTGQGFYYERRRVMMVKNTAKKAEIERVEYRARPGAPFPTNKAEEVGIALEKIRLKNKGVLHTSDVLFEAQKTESKLHPYFEWKDGEAAEKWRLHQARLLVDHVEVVYIGGEIEESHPQYINIQNVNEDDKNSPERAYVDSVTVGNNEFLRQQALKSALQQLIHWKEKYKWLNELNTIVLEIIKLENKLDT